jgi:glyoxylase I family protein
MALEIRGLAPLLQVFDMPTSVRFYRDILGFELVTTSEPGDHFSWALLRMKGMELMLNTAYEDGHRPLAPDLDRFAGHADMTLFFSCPDVDEAYRQLQAEGLQIKEPVIRDYGMKQLYVADPDGYQLCFQWSIG